MNELTDLELLFLSIANSRLIPARYIGFTGKKYTFEALKKNFGRPKNGSQILWVSGFEVADFEIEEKKVLIIK